MKTCPVCKTSLFDDMEVCYGCMYAFGSKPELEQRAAEQRAQEQLAQRPSAHPMAPMAGWTVRLEMKNVADPSRSWSMELAPAQPMAASVTPVPSTASVAGVPAAI